MLNLKNSDPVENDHHKPRQVWQQKESVHDEEWFEDLGSQVAPPPGVQLVRSHLRPGGDIVLVRMALLGGEGHLPAPAAASLLLNLILFAL